MHSLKANLSLTSWSVVFLFLPSHYVPILVADKTDTAYVKQQSSTSTILIH